MINSILGAKSAAFYSIGYNIGMLLLLVIGAVFLSIGPDFYKYMDDKRYDKIDKLVERMFCFILLFAFVLILFGENVLYLLADPKFYPGAIVIPPVVSGYIFYAIYYYYGTYIFYHKRTLYFTVCTLIAGTINIILNLIFIPMYGYLAAAYTTLFSYLVLFLVLWLIEKYIFKFEMTPLKIFINKIIIFYFIMLGYYIISRFFIDLFYLGIIIKLFFLGIIFVVLFRNQMRAIISL
jgi:O-antigen/teichoic acid export membrane protein